MDGYCRFYQDKSRRLRVWRGSADCLAICLANGSHSWPLFPPIYYLYIRLMRIQLLRSIRKTRKLISWVWRVRTAKEESRRLKASSVAALLRMLLTFDRTGSPTTSRANELIIKPVRIHSLIQTEVTGELRSEHLL